MIRHEQRYDVQAMTKAEQRVFNVWKSMKARCRCDRNPAYYRYGGRGIKICDRWHDSFMAFVADVGIPDDPTLELDRVNNDGNYEPGNWRWATRKQNMRNYSRNIHLTINGVTKVAADWADSNDIDRQTFYSRVRNGVTGADLLIPAVKHMIEIDGVTKPAVEWARSIGMRVNGFLHRYNMGWRGSDLLKPSQKKKCAVEPPKIPLDQQAPCRTQQAHE